MHPAIVYLCVSHGGRLDFAGPALCRLRRTTTRFRLFTNPGLHIIYLQGYVNKGSLPLT